MAEIDIDLSDRVPQKVSTTGLNNATVAATMGCSTLELDADIEVRDWVLNDPHGRSSEEVRRIRDEIRQRVSTLFDEYASEQ